MNQSGAVDWLSTPGLISDYTGRALNELDGKSDSVTPISREFATTSTRLASIDGELCYEICEVTDLHNMHRSDVKPGYSAPLQSLALHSFFKVQL